jgi:chromosomal replication initiation ATPase DnaA
VAKVDPEKINEFIAKVCKNENISIEELKAGGRRREASRVRAQIAIGLVKIHGLSLAGVASHIGVSTSTV